MGALLASSLLLIKTVPRTHTPERLSLGVKLIYRVIPVMVADSDSHTMSFESGIPSTVLSTSGYVRACIRAALPNSCAVASGMIFSATRPRSSTDHILGAFS